MWNLVAWIVLGGLAGWLAWLIIAGRTARQDLPGYIVAGIVGAALGGLIYGMFSGQNVFANGFSLGGLLVAIAGAALVLAVGYLFRLINAGTVGHRIMSGIGLVVSTLVLILVLAGIIGTWWIRQIATEAGDQALTAVENVAQAGQARLTRVDSALTETQGAVGEIAQASTQLSQNVADKGLLQTLLPPAKVERLQTAAQQVDQTLSGLIDIIDSGMAFLEALNKMPFVDLPTPNPEQVARIRDTLVFITDKTQELTGGIADLRAGVAAKISVVSTSVAELGTRLQTLQADLAKLKADLANVQAKAGTLKANLPGLLVLLAVILTLPQLWIAYALLVTIQRFWAGLRTPRDQTVPTSTVPA